jgi:hypothetical protein
MTVLGLDPRIDPVIFIGWLLTGIASFAICYGLPMAGSSPAMTGIKSRNFRPLVLYQGPLGSTLHPVMAGLDPAIGHPHQFANDPNPVSKAGSSPAMTGLAARAVRQQQGRLV